VELLSIEAIEDKEEAFEIEELNKKQKHIFK